MDGRSRRDYVRENVFIRKQKKKKITRSQLLAPFLRYNRAQPQYEEGNLPSFLDTKFSPCFASFLLGNIFVTYTLG